jgi:hypothetical protein
MCHVMASFSLSLILTVHDNKSKFINLYAEKVL